MIALIPASVRICDKTGASGRIPVKHLADSNGSRYTREDLRDCRGRIHRSSAHTAAEDLTGKLLLAARIVNLGILLSLFQMQTQRISLQVQLDSIPISNPYPHLYPHPYPHPHPYPYPLRDAGAVLTSPRKSFPVGGLPALQVQTLPPSEIGSFSEDAPRCALLGREAESPEDRDKDTPH